MFDQSKRGRLYRQGEQLRVLKEAARVEIPSPEAEIAKLELIIGASFSVAAVYARLARAPAPPAGMYSANSSKPDWPAEAAKQRERLKEHLIELRALVDDDDAAWAVRVARVTSGGVQ